MLMMAAMLALMAQAGAEAKEPDSAPVPIENMGSYFGADAYPPDAIRKNEEGRVVAMLDIDDKGFPTRCSIKSTSGSVSLDETTCAIAMQRIRFKPAMAANRPVASHWTLPVRWALPDGSGDTSVALDMSKVSSTSMAEVDLDAAGRVVTCVAPSSAKDAPDPCAPFPKGRMVHEPIYRDGKAVAAHLRVLSLTTVDPQP